MVLVGFQEDFKQLLCLGDRMEVVLSHYYYPKIIYKKETKKPPLKEREEAFFTMKLF
jgi:hypothetical protein